MVLSWARGVPSQAPDGVGIDVDLLTSRNSLPSLWKCSWTACRSPVPWATVLSGQVWPPVVTPSSPGDVFNASSDAPIWYGPTPSTLNSASAATEADALGAAEAEAEVAPDGWPDACPEPVGGVAAACLCPQPPRASRRPAAIRMPVRFTTFSAADPGRPRNPAVSQGPPPDRLSPAAPRPPCRRPG